MALNVHLQRMDRSARANKKKQRMDAAYESVWR